MQRSDPAPILAALHDVMEREAIMIRKADFSALTEATGRREHLLTRLAQAATPSQTALEALRLHGQRNQALMGAALKGVRAARRRIEMLRNVQTSLNTYDKLGKRRDIATSAASVERRV